MHVQRGLCPSPYVTVVVDVVFYSLPLGREVILQMKTKFCFGINVSSLKHMD